MIETSSFGKEIMHIKYTPIQIHSVKSLIFAHIYQMERCHVLVPLIGVLIAVGAFCREIGLGSKHL